MTVLVACRKLIEYAGGHAMTPEDQTAWVTLTVELPDETENILEKIAQRRHVRQMLLRPCSPEAFT